MENKIYPRNFPSFVRFRIEKGFRKELIEEALNQAKQETVKADDLTLITKDFEKPPYKFLFGEIEGRIVEALQPQPLSTKEIIEKTGLKKNTFYHEISQMTREGMIVKDDRRYGLKNPLYIRYSSLKKGRSLSPQHRKTSGVSKDEVILALYLWPKYQDARAKEGLEPNHIYSTQYNNVFSLAHAIKMWRKGSTNIPQWALIPMAALTGLTWKLNNDLVIESYSLPPGIEIKPFYHRRYKIPIEADLDLDKIVIQLWSKGTDNGRKYNHRNKKKFFQSLHKIFGSFKSREGRVPLVVAEIIKKYYEIEYFKKERARIPQRIIERLHRLNDPERAEHETKLLEGIIELGSTHMNGCEITSRSQEFLQDTSRFLEGMGDGSLSVRKRYGRPHYRSTLSSGKIMYIKNRSLELERLYDKIRESHPDFEIWTKIPLNNIGDRIRKMELSKPLDAVDRICREELFNYVGSILKSIERNVPSFGSGYFDPEDQVMLTDYFWDQRMVPDRGKVMEQLSEPERRWVTNEQVLSSILG
ncbi:MAG: hypothetical protein V3R82_01060 [Candidatus Hydrothermarchaeales archaeon]